MGNAGPGGAAGAINDAGGGGGGEGDWNPTSLSADDKTFLDGLGHKGLAPFVHGYKSMVGFQRTPQERQITLPEQQTADSMRPVFAKLGTPGAPDGYELPASALPEGAFDMQPKFREWGHEAQLTNVQAQLLNGRYNAFVSEQVEAQRTEREAASTKQVEAVFTGWGDKADENKAAASRFLGFITKKFNLDDAKVGALEDALESDTFLEMAALFGANMTEDGFVDQGAGIHGSGLTQQGAAQKIQALEADKDFMEAYMANDGHHPGHKAAVEEMARLQRLAAGAPPNDPLPGTPTASALT